MDTSSLEYQKTNRFIILLGIGMKINLLRVWRTADWSLLHQLQEIIKTKPVIFRPSNDKGLNADNLSNESKTQE